MKCIKQTPLPGYEQMNIVIRTTDSKAKKMVAAGDFQYASKEEWKYSGRYYFTPSDKKLGDSGRGSS